MKSSSIPTTELENESATDQPNWLELPRDVTENILQRLTTIEIVTSACQVCPLWWNICKEPHMWRIIRMKRLFFSRYSYGDNVVKIFLNAVQRSCGQVEEIDTDIEEIGTDDLLKYIVDNCGGHLLRMRLANCEELSDEGFSEAIKKLPKLEELEISFNHQLSNDSLEVVGRYCPLLKSLKCSGYVSEDDTGIDGYSFAIAKTMPGLHHLKISGEMPSDDGILAILDGCPLLESFDLGGCYSESLVIRCREQIKLFVPPSEEYYYSSDYTSEVYYYSSD